jgi:hypothetical protein
VVIGSLVVFSNELWKTQRLALWKTKLEDSGGSTISGHIYWGDICIVLDYAVERKVFILEEEVLIGPEVFILTQNGIAGWLEADALICI